MKKRNILIGVLAVFIVFAGIAAVLGFYPIAKVQGHYVLKHDVEVQTRVLEHVRGLVQQDQAQNEDLRKVALFQLITRKVMEDAVEELGLENQVQEDLEKALATTTSEKVGNATEVLYGLSFGEFKDRMLAPLAREAAVRRKIEESQAFDTWLQDRMKNASVSIYGLPYRWQDGKVESK